MQHNVIYRGLLGLIIMLPATACSAQGQPDGPGERPGSGPEMQDQRRGPMEAIDLPEPEVTITIEGNCRVIRSNGLPDHETGTFPNQDNPNALRPQNHEYKIPLEPEVADRLTPARPEFGIALNGVIFDAGTGEFWTSNGQRGHSAWNYAANELNQDRFGLDHNHAHVQPTGKYHYHGVPEGILEAQDEAIYHDGHAHDMILLGWAFDGFPIYAPFGYEDPTEPESKLIELTSSYRLKDGNRPESPDGPGGEYDGTFAADFEFVEGSGHLDQANGRTGVTPEFPDGTYYYVITESFPYIPTYWRGTPDASLQNRGGGDRGENGPDGRPGVREPRGERPSGPPPRERRGPSPDGQ